MLQSMKKSLLFVCALTICVASAKFTFQESELSGSFDKKMRSGLKKVVRQFGSEAKKTKEQVLNMIFITFSGTEAMTQLMEADTKTKEAFTNKLQNFIENLTSEALALQQMIGEVLNTIITNEMKKGADGYFNFIKSEDDFKKEFAKLSVTYQLVVYDELYSSLKPNEQQSFFDTISLTAHNKKSKKLLPKPEELYFLLQETIERTLKFMSELDQLVAQEENGSVNQ